MNRNDYPHPRRARGIGGAVALVLAVLAAGADTPPPKVNVVQPLPDKVPAWLEGYRLRWPLRVVGDPAKQKSVSVITSIPTGGWLKPDATDVAVQAASGEVLPVTILSHDPAGETIIQFPRKGNDAWYWAYGVNPAPKPAPKAPPMQEGVTVEVREWAGDDLANWAAVRAGLQKSENVIGNAVIPDILQNTNPARPGEVRKFAASYRGFLQIDKPGVYRFFANADDAVFVFIDGFKVFERAGSNRKLTGVVPINKIGADVELKAGVHPIEVHHVLGNNPDATGTMALLWKTPEAKAWALVPPTACTRALYALPSALEEARKLPAASFCFGIDDTLQSGPVTAFLVRFEANGALKDSDRLQWDFGDGTTGSGRSVHHVYFKPGNYKVALTSANGLAPFRRSVHVWPAPGATSPLSLAAAVRALASDDWTRAGRQRLNEMVEFLSVCERPERWKLLEAVTAHLLATETDLTTKATLLNLRIEALAEVGRASDALALAEKSYAEFARLPTQLVTLELAAASVYHRQMKDFAEASKRYKALLEKHRRLEHPALRVAAIRWGDLFAETGDLARAGETYRLAATLGGDKFKATPQSEAITRGALLRIAEQRLRSGDIRQTRQMLERIEMDYPEQKIEGLYRFLRAEADRHGGRYEEALRNYEVLVKLVQWAGFRDRALFGITDCYTRMGDEARALEWLAGLKDSFPRYYEKQKLADYRKDVEARRDRKKKAKPADPTDPVRDTFVTGFEPGEKGSFGTPENFVVVPALGIAGPHVGLLDGYPVYRGYFGYSRPLHDLGQTGSYWVEFWYRDTLGWGLPLNNPHTHAWIQGEGQAINGNAGMGTVYYERTLGRWRKISFDIKGPPASEGKLLFSIRHDFGVMELDGISVRPVSDREHDSLVNFLEGPPTP
jgi:tetratricopeptide (TPR) repeat protein